MEGPRYGMPKDGNYSNKCAPGVKPGHNDKERTHGKDPGQGGGVHSGGPQKRQKMHGGY